MSAAEQPNAPYLDALVAYGYRGSTRFHVPGHKGGPGADPGLVNAIGLRALRLDVPQDIEGIDLGPRPTPWVAPLVRNHVRSAPWASAASRSARS